MRIAGCDPAAFYPFRSLVEGRLEDVHALTAIERFMRTVVLHDEILMEMPPLSFDPEGEDVLDDEELQNRNLIVAIGPTLAGYNFFTDTTGPERPVPDIDLAPALIEAASLHANATEGNVYFEAAIKYLKRLLGLVEKGGSVLLCDEFGQQVVANAQRFPDALFAPLDETWQAFAKALETDGIALTVPPVLGIVLTRCARRAAIPTVLRDLRDEWGDARRRMWDCLDALRFASTLGEANEIQRDLADASRLFSPQSTEADTRPVRVLWEILAAATAGAVIGEVSVGRPVIGAITASVTQSARSLPPLIHEFGRSLFSRGAFDLAKKVQRASATIDLAALDRLLSDAEKRRLGL